MADRLDVLGDLASGPPTGRWRNVTTATVLSELGRNGLTADGSWLETVHVEAPEELRALIAWIGRMEAGQRDLGEATVCAWAELNQGTVVIDDAEARKTATKHGLVVHGSLWVFAEAVRCGRISSAAASGLVNELIASGARYPCPADGFETWVRRMRLDTP